MSLNRVNFTIIAMIIDVGFGKINLVVDMLFWILGCDPSSSSPIFGEQKSEEAQLDDTQNPDQNAEVNVYGQILDCQDPVTEILYTEHSLELGLQHHPRDPNDFHGDQAAIVIHDFNHDGWMDIALSYPENGIMVYFWERDHFALYQEIKESLYLDMALLDFSGDDQEDLVLASYDHGIELWEYTDTGFVLQSISFESQLHQIHSLTPFHLNDDGILDLYLGANSMVALTQEGVDQILVGNGDTFDFHGDITAQNANGYHYLSLPIDVDWDGQPEIYVINDWLGGDEPANSLLKSNGGQLFHTDVDCYCEPSLAGMGGSIADANQDGFLDIFLTASSQLMLMSSMGDGTYVQTTLAMGLNILTEHHQMAWGSKWLDFNNDGLEDLLVVEGDFGTPSIEVASGMHQPIDLFQQTSLGHFDLIEVGLNAEEYRLGRAIQTWDFNQDGILDILSMDDAGIPRLFLSNGCTEKNWLGILTTENALVEIVINGEKKVAMANSKTGYNSSITPNVWFGLDDETLVDELWIQPAFGQRQKVAEKVNARQILDLR